MNDDLKHLLKRSETQNKNLEAILTDYADKLTTKDAEIERLNQVLVSLNDKVEEQSRLITELADALDHESWVSEQQCGLPSQFVDLIQRAREVVSL